MAGAVAPNFVTMVVPPGMASVAADPGLPVPPLEALTLTFGREFQALHGRPATLLLRDFGPQDTTALVESTFGFPEAGAFFAGGRRFTYTSRSDGAFHDVASAEPRVLSVAALSEVVLDPASVAAGDPAAEHLSTLDQTRRDTQIGLAEGDWFDALAAMYGMPRPAGVPLEDWRGAVLACAVGPRGTPGTTWQFLVAALKQYELTTEVTLDPAAPQDVVATAGAGVFGDGLQGRWVLIDDVPYLIASVNGAGDTLALASMGTPYWQAADWSSLGAVTTTTLRVLAFVLREPTPGPDYREGPPYLTHPGRAAMVEVLVFGGSLPSAPPSYLKLAGEARPAGQPFGGHIQADEFEATSTVVGPHPLYLSGRTVLHPTAKVLKALLASGHHAEFIRVEGNLDLGTIAT